MPRWQAGVTVMLKPVVNDPQGLAVESGLKQLGYRGVSNVRVGKYIELALVAEDERDARIKIEEMCDKLLANPVIEDYAYVVDEAYGDTDVGNDELDTEAW
ncbi:MAG: phosphoribosylformylglycinamidine synthase subunit PurS [Chloroflexota bacterium]|nr:phosphoribosylformylglycinamidine synthase subunit PurS [Chloroflexota bacterium]MDQ6908823.1 phosphoribosylformylglycinamidine synthase subunit PurS [Chloroflexota bacterium]